MEERKRQQLHNSKKLALLVFAFCLLAGVYIFQQINLLKFFLSCFGLENRVLPIYSDFVFNKTVRLILNDFACFILIHIFFSGGNYLKVAFWVFLFELFVLLPVYFIVKLKWEGDSEISSPLLSQIHRLIVNPTLMILLMLAFFYQRFSEKKQIS